jgi:hypothetical protein
MDYRNNFIEGSSKMLTDIFFETKNVLIPKILYGLNLFSLTKKFIFDC